MRFLKETDEVLTILEIGERFPRCLMKRVTLPFHEVLDSRAMMAFLQECFYFKLRLTLNNERWRMRMRCAGSVESRGIIVWEEFAHMEHVVNVHVGREVKGASC